MTAKPLILLVLDEAMANFWHSKHQYILNISTGSEDADGYISVTAVDFAGPLIMKCSFNNPSKRSTIL